MRTVEKHLGILFFLLLGTLSLLNPVRLSSEESKNKDEAAKATDS